MQSNEINLICNVEITVLLHKYKSFVITDFFQ